MISFDSDYLLLLPFFRDVGDMFLVKFDISISFVDDFRFKNACCSVKFCVSQMRNPFYVSTNLPHKRVFLSVNKTFF